MKKTYTAEWQCNECESVLTFVTNKVGSYEQMAWDHFQESGWEDFGGHDAYHCAEHAESD